LLVYIPEKVKQFSLPPKCLACWFMLLNFTMVNSTLLGEFLIVEVYSCVINSFT
jgi:hypothetical protein